MAMRAWRSRRYIVRGSLTLVVMAAAMVLIAGAGVLLRAEPADAHCDSVNGPVVGAARLALERNDVRLVLPYVKPDGESELTAAFRHTMEARMAGPAAAEVADRWFFETAVRLHRAGEGASFTGLKDTSDFGPALEAADHALHSGSVDEVIAVLNAAISEGVIARFQAVQVARAEADQAGTVEAQRERAETELMFEQYVEQIYVSARGGAHQSGGEAAGHAHETGN